jgi:hypothetical protein
MVRTGAAQIPGYERYQALVAYPSGTSYDEALKQQLAGTQKAREELGPLLESTANVGTGMLMGTGAAKAGLTFLGESAQPVVRAGMTVLNNSARPLLHRMGLGALEAGLWGAGQAANQTYTGDLPDYVRSAGYGFVPGAILGGALPAIGATAAGIYKKVSDHFSKIPLPILRSGEADEAGLANLHNLGPDAMLAEAGPSMRAETAAAAQGSGEAHTQLENAVTARNAATAARLQADREAALGPAPRVSKIEDTIEQGRKDINANDYAPVLAGRTIDPQRADSVIASINQLGRSSRVDLSHVNEALTVPGSGNLPDLSAQSWLNARHNLDSMITQASKKGDNYTAGVLGRARGIIDNELDAHVPGIKIVDAKFAANRAEQAALEAGQKTFATGNNAIHPEDLRDLLTAAPTAVKLRYQQGAHAALDQNLATHSRDLSPVQNLLGSPWNAEKSRIVFGPQAAGEIEASVARNKAFQNTYNQVVGGSKTAQTQAAVEQGGFRPRPPEGSETLFGFGVKGYNWAKSKLEEVSNEQQRNYIAQILAARDPAQVLAARDAILNQNRHMAKYGPLVNKYSQAATQGGMSSLASPLFYQEPP